MLIGVQEPSRSGLVTQLPDPPGSGRGICNDAVGVVPARHMIWNRYTVVQVSWMTCEVEEPSR